MMPFYQINDPDINTVILTLKLQQQNIGHQKLYYGTRTRNSEIDIVEGSQPAQRTCARKIDTIQDLKCHKIVNAPKFENS